jgi:hypothetical protein
MAVVEEGANYRFQPASPELTEMIEALVELYARKPVAVVRAIITAPNNKIQTFADAFRFKQ